MKKISLLLLIAISFGFTKPKKQFIVRNGQATFFSYASAENIKAENNEVLSIIDIENSQIAVSILMRAFEFEKSLMQEHFNDSYIESDIYPKATFQGTILNFKPNKKGKQTRYVKGDFTLRGVTQPLKIKTDIEYIGGTYIITGETTIDVKDYKIKIPQILSSKIAKTVKITFNFKYESYEK